MNRKNLLWSVFAIMMATTLSVGFASCSSDDDDKEIDTSPITLYAGNKTILEGANEVVSENSFIAFINNDKSIEGFHVGETFIKVNGKYRIPLTVKGKYNTHNDPVTNWGCSQSYVKSHQTQGTLSSKSTNEMLVYENVGHADLLGYSFENGKLNGIITMVKTAYTSEYAGYLAERYFMIPYETDDDTYFVGIDALETKDAKTFVMLEIYNATYLSTVYMPFSKASSSANSKSNVIKKMKKAFPLN